MNLVIIMGRLPRDPEVKYTKDGMAIANFTVGVDKPFSKTKEKREKTWIKCVAFGKTAETIGNYLQAKSDALVVGRYEINNWEDKEGKKHSDAYVAVDKFEFVGSKNSSGGNQQSNGFDSFGQSSDLPFEI